MPNRYRSAQFIYFVSAVSSFFHMILMTGEQVVATTRSVFYSITIWPSKGRAAPEKTSIFCDLRRAYYDGVRMVFHRNPEFVRRVDFCVHVNN